MRLSHANCSINRNKLTRNTTDSLSNNDFVITSQISFVGIHSSFFLLTRKSREGNKHQKKEVKVCISLRSMRSWTGEGRKRGKGEIKTRENARGRKEEGSTCWQAIVFFSFCPPFPSLPLAPLFRFSRARNPLRLSFQTPAKQAKIASSCWNYLDNYCRKKKWICLPGCDAMWTESAQVNFLPRFFSREVFYKHVVPGQKRENITTRGSQEKKLKLRRHYSSRN